LEEEKFVRRFLLFEDGKSRGLALRNELGGGAVKGLTPEGVSYRLFGARFIAGE
jgi:hypothetical protein